jgi:hypothetical protein
MTRLQQVLFEVAAPTYGHPYFVTGHALWTALARRLEDDRLRQSLAVSNGVFVPGEYGRYPEAHSQDGYAGKLGTELPPVEQYADLFVFRDAAHRWLADRRPRDGHNVLDIQQHGDRRTMAPQCWFGRPERMRNHRRSMQWYVHCYLHTTGGHGHEGESLLPISEDILDGIRVGGGRNYGFGELTVADTQVVDLDSLSFEGIRAAAADDQLQLELLAPYVVDSTAPGADDQTVPWWWGLDDRARTLRRRESRLVDGDDVHTLETIDHGQVVRYAGSEPVRTARNGVLRVGTHSKYGFGEFRLRPATDNRVPAHATAGDHAQHGGQS